jgi:hypothetical protein
VVQLMRQRLGRIHNRKAAYATYPSRNHGFWLNNYQGICPCGPKTTDQNPKQSVSLCQSGMRILSL